MVIITLVTTFIRNISIFLDAANEDSKAEENIDWHLKAEIEKYELGKRWLATMMGEDVDTFTDEKIAVCFLLIVYHC